MNALIRTLLAVTALIAVGPGGATAAASTTSGCGPLTSSPAPPTTPYAHRLLHHHARLAVDIRIKMTNGSGVSRALQRRAVIVKRGLMRTAFWSEIQRFHRTASSQGQIVAANRAATKA